MPKNLKVKWFFSLYSTRFNTFFLKNTVVSVDEGENSNNNLVLSPVIKKRKAAPSIKVGCTSYFANKNYTNGEVEVVYHWKHLNHDPFNLEFVVEESRLSPNIKK